MVYCIWDDFVIILVFKIKLSWKSLLIMNFVKMFWNVRGKEFDCYSVTENKWIDNTLLLFRKLKNEFLCQEDGHAKFQNIWKPSKTSLWKVWNYFLESDTLAFLYIFLKNNFGIYLYTSFFYWIEFFGFLKRNS